MRSIRLSFIMLFISVCFVGCGGSGGNGDNHQPTSDYNYHISIEPDDGGMYSVYAEMGISDSPFNDPTLIINGSQISLDRGSALMNLTPGESLTIKLSHSDFPTTIEKTTNIPTMINGLSVNGDISQWVAKSTRNIEIRWTGNNSCNTYWIGVHRYSESGEEYAAEYFSFTKSPAVLDNSVLKNTKLGAYPSYVGFSVTGFNFYPDSIYQSSIRVNGPESNIISNLPG